MQSTYILKSTVGTSEYKIKEIVTDKIEACSCHYDRIVSKKYLGSTCQSASYHLVFVPYNVGACSNIGSRQWSFDRPVTVIGGNLNSKSVDIEFSSPNDCKINITMAASYGSICPATHYAYKEVQIQ